MSSSSRSEAPFLVIARHRPSSSDGDSGKQPVRLLEMARSLGSSAVDMLGALTAEGDLFAISYWLERASADRYFDAIEREWPGVLSNIDRTELRSDPMGSEAGSFHALILARHAEAGV